MVQTVADLVFPSKTHPSNWAKRNNLAEDCGNFYICQFVDLTGWPTALMSIPCIVEELSDGCDIQLDRIVSCKCRFVKRTVCFSLGIDTAFLSFKLLHALGQRITWLFWPSVLYVWCVHWLKQKALYLCSSPERSTYLRLDRLLDS